MPYPQGEPVPYDDALGTFAGVVAYSNRDDGFFSGEKKYLDGVHCGFKWQCVEFSRRYLLERIGCLFTECTRASEIFEKLELTNVETGDKHVWPSHPNGGTVRPGVGDVLIYPYHEEHFPWGHVAVISHFEAAAEPFATHAGGGVIVGRAGIAEQNQATVSWGSHPYGRLVDVVRVDGSGDAAWFLREAGDNGIDSLGWKPLPATCAFRPHGAALRPLPAFVASYKQATVVRNPLPEPVLPLPPAPSAEATDEEKKKATEPTPSQRLLQASAGPSDRFASVYTSGKTPAAGQGYGELFIGGAHKAGRLAVRVLTALFAARSDSDVATLFGLPDSAFAAAARSTFAASRHGHVQGVGQFELQCGTEAHGLDGVVLVRAALDSMKHLAATVGFERSAAQAGGFFGFVASGITGDFSRLTATLAGQAKTPVVHFVDVSGGHDVQRADFLALFEAASTGFAAAGVTGVSAKRVDGASLTERDGDLFDADGTRVLLAFKSAPWAELIGPAASGNAGAALLVKHAARVLQPPWAHLVDHAAFLPEAQRLIESGALDTGDDAAEDARARSEALALLPSTTERLVGHRGLLPKCHADHGGSGPQFYTTTSVYTVGGYFSAVVCLETVEALSEAPLVADRGNVAMRPAAMCLLY